MLAWIFRSLDANIITTRFEWVRKLLKLLLIVSQGFAKRSLRRSKNNEPTWCVINNFDGDIKLKVDRSRTMGASFFWTGLHEVREFIFLHRFLREEMIVIDIGANLGEYTLFSAKRVKKGQVFSFEPMKRIYNLLKENITLNQFYNVQLFNYGISDSNRTMFLHEIEGDNEGLGTIYPGEKRSLKKEEIVLRSLDEEVDSFNISHLDFVKIDIEGAEFFALRGAKRTIQNFQPIVMVEISDDNYKAAGYSTSDVVSFFSEMSYSPHQVNKRGELELCQKMPAFGNVIFVPTVKKI